VCAQEFEELLTTVVHMGLAATEHLLLTPISPYRDGPQYLVSMTQVERLVKFIPNREAILVIDQGHFACRLYDPSMKRALAVDLPLSSALAVEYVSGVQVDTQQQNQSYRRGQNARASYYNSGRAPSAKDERAEARKAMEAANALHHKGKETSMWDKISAMPLSKPLRMENGQPVLHGQHAHAATAAAKGGHADHSQRGDEPHAAQTNHPKATSATLISQYAAQPYYSSAVKFESQCPTSLLCISVQRTKTSQHERFVRSSAAVGDICIANICLLHFQQSSLFTTHFCLIVAVSAAVCPTASLHSLTPSSSSRAGGAGGPSSSSSSSSAYDRQPLVFLQEDWLVTSTSQHLQLWDGMPTGPVSLCDQKKIKNSYATIKWCPVLQKLFCGDVIGGIDVWRIVLLPPAATAAVGHTNKPTLVKVGAHR
jgi:hypothetical protein